MILEQLNQSKAELSKLNQSFASLSESFKKLIAERKQTNADMDDDKMKDEDKMGEMMDMMDQMMSNVHYRIDAAEKMIYRMSDSLYSYQSEHQRGHHPPMSPSAMQKFLKNVGMDGDFEVSKHYIYASKGRHYLEVEMKKPS